MVFKGSIAMAATVDVVVIATDSERSAFAREHRRFE